MGNATQHLGSDHMEFSVYGKSDLEAQAGEAGTHTCPKLLTTVWAARTRLLVKVGRDSTLLSSSQWPPIVTVPAPQDVNTCELSHMQKARSIWVVI